MTTTRRRLAVHLGGGWVSGLEHVLRGTLRAAAEQGWDVAGLRDGFEGLLFPERYAGGGVVGLALDNATAGVLGTSSRVDPFRVQALRDHQIEEVDASDDLLARLRAEGVDAVVSVVDHRGLSTLLRLHRKGLRVVCIPESIENDVAATSLSFGFNSALGQATALLDSALQAAQAARRLGVVEVPGAHAGWLALQAAIAVGADAVLLPEIPYDLEAVAVRLAPRLAARPHGLVVVASGARAAKPAMVAAAPDPMRSALSPLATGPSGARVIHRSGQVAHEVALELQRRCGIETYPLALGDLIKGGAATAVDRQLGMGYGAAAVQALTDDRTGVMVSFQAPDLAYLPLQEAVNKYRTVPPQSVFMQVARSLGLCLGVA